MLIVKLMLGGKMVDKISVQFVPEVGQTFLWNHRMCGCVTEHTVIARDSGNIHIAPSVQAIAHEANTHQMVSLEVQKAA